MTQRKTPIAYYGGKQQLAARIVEMIPEHSLYVEGFFGGGAVFWAKGTRPDDRNYGEVVNDLNGEVYNFWQQCRDNFDALQTMVQNTLYARVEHRRAALIYSYPECFTPLERAWAFWVQTNMSYAHKVCGGWALASSSREGRALENKKTAFDEAVKQRLKHVQVENKPALELIQNRDSCYTFFYLDPPYPNSDQGHYAGYTMQDFLALIDVLSRLQGKFLLSSYDYPELTEAAAKYGWRQERIEMALPTSSPDPTTGKKKRKVEVLTCNY